MTCPTRFPTKSTVGYDNQAELAPSCMVLDQRMILNTISIDFVSGNGCGTRNVSKIFHKKLLQYDLLQGVLELMVR